MAKRKLICCCTCKRELFTEAFSAGNLKRRRYECKRCVVKRSRKWNRKHSDKVRKDGRRTHLMRSYGITEVEYEQLAASQGGRCAICGRVPAEGEKRLGVDHDHRTDKVRGLLCRGCNVGLGSFGDNPAMLQAALTYLNKLEALG